MAPPSVRSLCCCLALLVLLSFVSSPVVAWRDMQKRSFASLGCMGIYDKAKFARLDRVCEECYQMYREPNIQGSCRENCFKNTFFSNCVDALLLKDQEQKLNEMVDNLYGKRK